MKIKISREAAEELFFGDDYDDYKHIESSNFVSGPLGKWEHAYCVFEYDRYYKFHVSRTGSHYTEYMWLWGSDCEEDVECHEVEHVSQVVWSWEKVDDDN